MTSYTAIPNGDIDQDSPITQPLMTALRDNPIAITEGASGAPRIVGDAMFAPSAGTVVQRNCLPFGNEVLSGIGVSATLPASAFTALVACTVQFRVTCSVSDTPAILTIRKNGIGVQTYSSSQTGATTNVTLAAGDNVGVTLGAGTTGGGGDAGAITVSVLEIRVDTRSAVMT